MSNVESSMVERRRFSTFQRPVPWGDGTNTCASMSRGHRSVPSGHTFAGVPSIDGGACLPDEQRGVLHGGNTSVQVHRSQGLFNRPAPSRRPRGTYVHVPRIAQHLSLGGRRQGARMHYKTLRYPSHYFAHTSSNLSQSAVLRTIVSSLQQIITWPRMRLQFPPR